MEMDENQIIARCQRGQLENFGPLFDKYYRQIYNFIYYRTHHKEAAEDISSQVFFKALENIGSFNSGKGKFSTWLYQIARNSVIDHYRTFKGAEDIESAWDAAAAGNVERDTDAVLQLERVQGYLKDLPAQQRDIIIMRVWDGLSHREIAEVLGITEAASKVAFSRALGKLQKEALLIVLAAIVTSNNF